METYSNELLQILNQIEGNGSFVVSGTKEFMPLGLTVKGVNEISFPITATQIASMIKVAHKAPFGKGSQTILDTKVRSAWEIDAKNISFLNQNWGKLINKILEQTKVGLGIEQQTISANLYKLLIYEKNDFFLAHKDSEKEAGMFGTLIIGLPSKHTGGQLFVRFDGYEEIIDFSDPAYDYNLPYAAFFADCEHEIKPITSGHRVCLVYNLVQKQGQAKIQHTETAEYVNDLAELLKTAQPNEPIAVILGHEYTPTNFSIDELKHHDYPRAVALMEAAEKAGFYARLGLLTHYMMGDLQVDYNPYGRSRGRRYYDDDDDDPTENGRMGKEIYETYTRIEHWGKEADSPPLSTLKIKKENIISEIEIGEGEPTEKEAEGYTGNAGMTMEYWYHYGSIVLWQKSKHFELLNTQDIDAKLGWLKYCLNNWQTNDEPVIKKLITHFSDDDLRESYKSKDFSVIAPVLIKLKDAKFIESEPCQNLLVHIFDRINVANWIDLLNTFDAQLFKPTFKNAAKSNKITRVKHITAILESLQTADSKNTNPFLIKRIGKIPSYLDNYKLDTKENMEHIPAILNSLLRLSSLKNEDESWLEDTVNSLVKSLSRPYVNDILAATLLSSKANKTINLAKRLGHICQQDLIKRTIVQPTPPKTWTREVPKSTYNTRIWDILTPFLISPTQQVFDYARIQSERNSMESAISNVTIDLKMETIKRGSPHTLRLTKTQAAYENDLKRWHIDVALLKKLDDFFTD